MKDTIIDNKWGSRLMKIINKSIGELKEYKNNPRKNDNAVDYVARSISEFGFKVPIIVDAKNEIIAGHTRLKAAKKLGLNEVPVIVADDLTDEQIKAFRLIDNKTAEISEWDFELLDLELNDVFDIDMGQFGFENTSHFWGNYELEDNEEYDKFIDKFKDKKTTDDCYTPDSIYKVVKEWVLKEYKIDRYVDIIRPFYPGGDYKKYNYPKSCVVIDNPPFSILSEIVRFYIKNNIYFFLFAPHLQLFSVARGECNYVVCNAIITYENGAKVSTSFVTNMGEYKIMTAPDLVNGIEINCKKETAELPVYEYPENVLSAARMGKWAKTRCFAVKHAEFIRRLDAQANDNKDIYGCGFIISDKAAEKAAAEKEKAEKVEKEKTIYKLSKKEREIIIKLNELEGD